MVGAENVDTVFAVAGKDADLRRRFRSANKTLDWFIGCITYAHVAVFVVSLFVITGATATSPRNPSQPVHYSSFVFGAGVFVLHEVLLYFAVSSGWNAHTKDLYQRNAFKLLAFSLISFLLFAVITLFLVVRCTWTSAITESRNQVAYSVTDAFTCPISYREASGIQGGLLVFSCLATITAILYHAKAVLSDNLHKQA